MTSGKIGLDLDLDLDGIDPKDIELVMSQTGASLEKVIAALRRNQNDIVNAILELTL
ncbi:hypothetical protein [Pseudomonas kitaguniensis]|uniref:hypothetical protein n=1 Tax=Pseudomonas kitaguniensis TaxID=2607908 RepID=UPI0015626D23|nr:hypothetical protein [Pseudomonas kitaguniensis]